MKVINIKHFDEISRIVDDLRSPYNVLHFRGQECDSCGWMLQPTIARGTSTIDALLKKEQYLLAEFKNRINTAGLGNRILEKINPVGYQQDWEWLTQAQHYGLPTRLMDWSIDWRRSLCFATGLESNDHHDAQLWIYKCPTGNIVAEGGEDHWENFNMIDPFNVQVPTIIGPSYFYFPNHKDYIGQERRWRQMGKFLIQTSEDCLVPFEHQADFTDLLVKIIIPAALRKPIREHFAADGLDQTWLYGEKDEQIEDILKDLKRYKEII